MSAPPQPKTSPMVIGGMVGGGLVMVSLLVVVLVKIVQPGTAPGSVLPCGNGELCVQQADGTLVPLQKPQAVDDKNLRPPPPPAQVQPVGQPVAPQGQPGAAVVAPVDALAAPPPPSGEIPVVAAVQPEKTEKKKPPKKNEPREPVVTRPPPDDPKPGKKECDPILDLDCKTGPKPAPASAPVKELLTKGDVLVVVKANMGKVAACGNKHRIGGIIKMNWKIQPSGRVNDVVVGDGNAGTPVGKCVTDEVKSWRFPASKMVTPVSFPMKLGG